ncbi:sulfite exporter TauE/SafE family protein [Methanohalophilus sp. RSK]|uniref:sulfite exporter TauE/SafE family protein n=1 Tax=Methanohalophilus sp. RSK TaxID=2485783 RepID=UPI000F43DBC2|nr:sulfite exporter TauE/SafE family protein [Methanohalophilus sp. RSK]RNI15718.1 sulfite exporter TauE/SafE family protein [Methanohalophilus sp. RSK]
MDVIIIAAIIFFLAVIFSMLGLGGSLVYVPLFYWLGIDMLIAIPTALLLNGITASSAAITYYRKKMIDFHVAAPFVIASTIGAPLGAYFTKFVSIEILLWILSTVLVFAGVRMLFSGKKDADAQISSSSTDKRKSLTGISLGFSIGVIAGLLGIGGGVFIFPILIALGYGAKRASATSAFIVLFSSFSGFFGHLTTGHLDMNLMIYTALAAFIGGQVGSHLMHSKMRSETIKQIFGVVLWIMAIKLVYGLM